MLSVLFATETWYTIKENNREKSFCQGKLPFCQLKLRKVEAKNLNFNYAFKSVLLSHPNTPSPDVCEIRVYMSAQQSSVTLRTAAHCRERKLY